MLSRTQMNSLLRQDFCGFIMRSFLELNPSTRYLPNWHIEVMAAHLEKCRRGETKRLIINVPPRSLKSHCASVAFPAWLLGQNPCQQIICASYAQELSNKLALDCRTLMMSDRYRALFPRTELSTKRKPEFVTTQGGVRFATSVGGTLTGRGADFLVIDDPLKPDEALSDVQRKSVNDWFDHTLYSRLNDKVNGSIIVIMQRLHEDDFVGHLLEQGGWELVRFPAIAEEDESHTIETLQGTHTFRRKAGEALHPEREPLEFLEKLKFQIGEYNFVGQYQQAPAPVGGGLVKREWFQTYTDLPPNATIVQSWDCANKASELNDFSVCTTWAIRSKNMYLIDVFRKRLEYPELKRAVHAQAERFGADKILIEDKASGTQLIQELRREDFCAVKAYSPKLEKVLRMHTTSNLIENGRVHLPETAAWLQAYLHEITMFPYGKHDDQVDSTSQFLDCCGSLNDVPNITLYYAMENMRRLRAQGRKDELRELEERYGNLLDEEDK